MSDTKRGRQRTYVLGCAMTLFLLHPVDLAAETLWIRASQAERLVGPVAFGQKVGMVEQGALGDFLVSTVCVSADELSGGYAEYRVEIPASGLYHVWARVRYPTGPPGSFAFIPRREEPTVSDARAIGGGRVGARSWHWAGRGSAPEGEPRTGRLSVKLPAGESVFRIYAREAGDTVFAPHNWRMARPMFNPRLNLICLTTDPGYVPTDVDARRALNRSPSQVDASKLRVEPADLPAVTEDELRRSGKKRIPDWLRCPRFYTKDAWRGELAFRAPGDIASMVRQIAACQGNAFRMAAYWGGDAYFQSRVAPHAPDLGQIDYLREAIDEGRRLGVKIVMYMNPNTLYDDHPLYQEAVVRQADGSLWSGPAYGIRNSHFVCINNPKYRRFLESVLTEVFTRYGPDGLYVDGLTPHRCFCKHCKAKYRAMWGRPMPAKKLAAGRQWTVLWEMVSRPEPVGDPTDPDTHRYTQFLYQSLAEATRLVSGTVKRSKPDAVTMYHSWPKLQTIDDYDGTLTEIYLRQPWQHSLWKFGELANYSNIFPIPVLFNIYLHDYGTEAEARTKMIQGLAGGCYPNCWNLLSMKPMFAFMRRNAECFDFLRTSPTKYLAFPRGVRTDSAQARLMADTSSAVGPLPAARPVRDRFLAPYVGFYSALVRSGLPIVTLQRSDFHHRLDGFRVLCLANEACLSDEQVEAVRQFVRAGGGLVATHETSLYDENGDRREDFGLSDVFGASHSVMLPAAARQCRLRNTHPVTQGLEPLEPLLHDGPLVAVRLAGGDAPAVLVGKDRHRDPPPAVVTHRYGAGRVVYLPGRWDAIQCDEPTPAIERLFAGAVRWVAGGKVPIEVTAAGPVSVTLFDQPDRRIVHLVSLHGDTRYASDRIEPIGRLGARLQIPDGCRVKSLRRLWDEADVPFQTQGDVIRFQLDKVGEYEVVAVELGRP